MIRVDQNNDTAIHCIGADAWRKIVLKTSQSDTPCSYTVQHHRDATQFSAPPKAWPPPSPRKLHGPYFRIVPLERDVMRHCFHLPLLCLFLTACSSPSTAQPLVDAAPSAASFNTDHMAHADRLIEAAIARGDIPGAVLLVGHQDKIVYRKAFGMRAIEPTKTAMTPDTIFDLASLTKVVATATSIMILSERGKLALTDPVSKYLPEFAPHGKDKITIEHLLLHRGGLTPDNHLRDYTDGRQQAWINICNLKLTAPVNTKFIYSDVGYIVLGEIIERLEGKRLNHFAHEAIYEPLGMTSTAYKPPPQWKPRIAPTDKRDGQWLVGDVHDPRAYWYEGVAGHAGLFSSADDLALFCRMMLRGGELSGKRVLSKQKIEEMTRARYLPDGSSGRGYGWDIDSAYSRPRGALFARGRAFGHTGFTGTSIWLDPDSQTFVILLASRLHPDSKGSTVTLSQEISTIAAQAAGLGKSPPPVQTGIDVLVAEKFKSLEGRKLALITNHTGRNQRGQRTIDLLHEAPNVALIKLFSPEHGLYGTLDEKVGHGVDEKTKLPVFSLYGQTRKPTKEMLDGIDTIIFDIQDIGTRFYTYMSTLGNAMEAASENSIRIIVLDRPNPITGLRVDGPLADAHRLSFVAYHSFPIVHGMTIGEMAQLVRGEKKLNCDLHIVKMRGWKRSMWFDQTGLTWINPSPNMRNLTQATLYPAIGLLEFSNLSVGRGTDQPFEFLGAPWIDGPALAAALNALELPGLRFVPIEFTPTSSKYKDEKCFGIYTLITDRQKIEPTRTGLSIAWQLMRNHGRTFEAPPMLKLLCNFETYEAMMNAKSPEKLAETWAKDAKIFATVRAKYLMYE